MSDTLDHLADLLADLRPDWDRWLISAVVRSHPSVPVLDLATAAIRLAGDPTKPVKAIGWRGPHWAGIASAPPVLAWSTPRCDVCGKTEDRCWLERPGPDDHPFTPRPARAAS